MRTRFRGDPTAYAPFEWGIVGNTRIYNGYIFCGDGETSAITDQLLQKRATGYCSHVVINRFPNWDPVVFTSKSGSVYYCSHAWARGHFSQVPSFWGSHAIELGDSKIMDLCAEAYDTMRPQLGGDLSVVNFILELDDLKRLVPVFQRRRSMLNNAASQNLNYRYGWKPFVSDMQEMWQALYNYKEKLHNLLSSQGQVQNRYFRKVVASDKFEYITHPSPPGYSSCVGSYETTFTATMQYKYNVANAKDRYLEVKALMDMLGFDRPLEVAWDAIPFSFAVDWFFSVGNFLQRKRSPWVKVSVDVLDFSYSIKTEYIGKFYRYDDTIKDEPLQFLGSFQSSVYDRRRAKPVEGRSFLPEYQNRFGLVQMGLAASLVTVLFGF